MKDRFKYGPPGDETSGWAGPLNPLPVAGYGGHTASVTWTRPNNTTAYAAGDAIGDMGGSAILTFQNIGRAGANILITAAELYIYLTALTAGMDTFSLELFNEQPDSFADNDAWDLTSAGDKGKHEGYISLGKPLDRGSFLLSQNDMTTGFMGKQIQLVTANLYGILRTDAAFTPTASTVKKLKLRAMEI
jgi:hypothetical protein